MVDAFPAQCVNDMKLHSAAFFKGDMPAEQFGEGLMEIEAAYECFRPGFTMGPLGPLGPQSDTRRRIVPSRALWLVPYS